jgi:adenine deaminase
VLQHTAFSVSAKDGVLKHTLQQNQNLLSSPPMGESLSELLKVARGDAPADLLLANARIVKVFTGQIESNDIAIHGSRIAGVGRGYEAKQTIDLHNACVAPGLIDAHVHIESSLCTPPNFASAVLPRGVTTVVADPHEIANVAGVDGIRFMVESARSLPLSVFFMAPSCVPATDMATSGAVLSADDLAKLLHNGAVHGLAEMMNFPGVISGDPEVLKKIEAFNNHPRDGHAPGLTAKAINAYVAAGIGSDHECTTVEEAQEKLARGLYILIREATNARNLDPLLPLITPENSRRICFCTDDRQPQDLLSVGGIDYMLRRAIERGVDPITAFRCCTLNTTEWFGLHDRGAIAPGRRADLFVFEHLESPRASDVYVGGQRFDPNAPFSPASVPDSLRRSCRADLSNLNFEIRARPGKIRVIGLRPDQLITDELLVEPKIHNGEVLADPSRDLLKMAVIERHRSSGNIGLGFIRGIGLTHGAIAGTVAHDHHNLVVIGCDDISMVAAAYAVCALGGGLVVTSGEHILAKLPLPVAGLMSDQPVENVRDGYGQLLAACRELGSPLHDPFMAMSFMALEVIPKLKLTDKGLVDVEAFRLVDLFVG